MQGSEKYSHVVVEPTSLYARPFGMVSCKILIIWFIDSLMRPMAAAITNPGWRRSATFPPTYCAKTPTSRAIVVAALQMTKKPADRWVGQLRPAKHRQSFSLHFPAAYLRKCAPGKAKRQESFQESKR